MISVIQNSPFIKSREINRQKNTSYNYYFNSLIKQDNCDRVSFSADAKKRNTMTLFYKATNNKYSPTSLEIHFKDALESFAEIKDNDNEEIKREKSINLENAFENMVYNQTELSDDNKIYIFSNLIEALDNSTEQFKSTALNYLLFESFLEDYSEDKCIQDTIKIYLQNNLLKKDILKLRTEQLLKI